PANVLVFQGFFGIIKIFMQKLAKLTLVTLKHLTQTIFVQARRGPTEISLSENKKCRLRSAAC
ncbi:MAG: hypothetical protein ACLU3G_09825, partial [Christensenellales bacterium]